MEILYTVPEPQRNPDGLRRLLPEHPEIRFASLAGVDLGGNDTDEKIPIGHFLADIEEFLSGGVQTDGSSVVLPGIATLNDGKVDLIADPGVRWYVDYNYEHKDATGLPVGTLRIPSFLKHKDLLIDSRAILKRTVDSFARRLGALLVECPEAASAVGVDPAAVRRYELVAATELEFWVRTPGADIATEKLSVSQVLQESYWKRTKGAVRTALEESLFLLDRYGLRPEMGHKEVGGIKAAVSGEGGFDGIMEQLEVDWRYTGRCRPRTTSSWRAS
jgi:glutamine synthetase